MLCALINQHPLNIGAKKSRLKQMPSHKPHHNKIALGESSQSEDPELERTFIGHKSGATITSIDFCPTMKRCASGGMDSLLMIWNFKPMMRVFKYTGHEVYHIKE
jgi:WD40 repeat protein